MVRSLGLVAIGAAGLVGCGGGGGSAQDAIRAAIVKSAALPDKSTCTDLFTDAGIKAFYTETDAATARHDCTDEAGQAANQARAKRLQVNGIVVSGDHATANAALGSRTAVYSMLRQNGTWKVDGVRAGSGAASTSSSATASASTASGPDTNRLALTAAAGGFTTASRQFISRVRADANAGNLTAVKSDASAFRDAIFAFDTQVRKITPPPSAQDAFNALLVGDRAAIGDLDSVGAASSPTEVGSLFRTRLAPDIQTLGQAESRLMGLL